MVVNVMASSRGAAAAWGLNGTASTKRRPKMLGAPRKLPQRMGGNVVRESLPSCLACRWWCCFVWACTGQGGVALGLQALMAPSFENVDELVTALRLVAAPVVALLAGAGLGLAGVLMQQSTSATPWRRPPRLGWRRARTWR